MNCAGADEMGDESSLGCARSPPGSARVPEYIIALLYRILLRLAIVVFGITGIALAILMLANLRETNWSNVQWGAIAGVIFGPLAILVALAWVFKPPG
jgi:hypothetical protein